MQTFLRLRHLVTGDIFVTFHVGADGEIEGRLVGIGHTDHTIAASGLSANGLHGHASLKAYLAFQTLVLRGDPMQVCGRNGLTFHF